MSKISVKNLWKVFGHHPEKIIGSILDGKSKEEVFKETNHVIAVRDVSFEVTEGEVFVVMGLSGSGKSTLLRCLNRLMEPTSGQVLVDGIDLSTMDSAALRELRRKKISMVFQHFALFPHRSVIENVASGLEVQGLEKAPREERALQALELVGLAGWENAYPDQLSGGMQQRVGLARALAVDPDIMLMDEPFSALDPLIRRVMQDEFIRLRSLVRKTVVFITHDLSEALKLGDRVAIVKDGVIIQIGTPQQIVTMPADSYVREFVRDVPRGKVLTARSVMEELPYLATADAAPSTLLEEMKTRNLETCFVISPQRRLLGFVTIEDVLRVVESKEVDVSRVIKDDFPVASPDSSIDDLLPMLATGETSIAVIDEERRPMGVVPRLSLLLAAAGKEAEA